MFFYERWDVFKAAVRLRYIAEELSRYRVPGAADDLNQLRRSTSSIVLNLAEGAKAKHLGKKLDRYITGQASAGEANAALLILACSLPRSASALISEGRELADRVSAMMTNLIRSVEAKWNDPNRTRPDPDPDTDTNPTPPPPPPPPPDA